MDRANAIYGQCDDQADVFHGHAAGKPYMIRKEEIEAAKMQAGTLGATSACTVGDRIDQSIRRAENELRSLIDLRGSLPGDFLRSPVSRIAGLVGR